MKSFENLPKEMQNDKVREYYDIVAKRQAAYIIKCVGDFILALAATIILILPMLVIAAVIKCTSKGPVIFKQTRVGRYMKPFKIWKFRTMRTDAEKSGKQLTVGERDPRITKIGGFLRKYRLDELPQLVNILLGQMSFVGARPEVPRYVKEYSGAMSATLLLRPGVTGFASIRFKDENELLGKQQDPEQAYIEKILPIKMNLDLQYVEQFGVWTDIKTMLETVKAVL